VSIKENLKVLKEDKFKCFSFLNLKGESMSKKCLSCENFPNHPNHQVYCTERGVMETKEERENFPRGCGYLYKFKE
jgi:hypothetical protein